MNRGIQGLYRAISSNSGEPNGHVTWTTGLRWVYWDCKQHMDWRGPDAGVWIPGCRDYGCLFGLVSWSVKGSQGVGFRD